MFYFPKTFLIVSFMRDKNWGDFLLMVSWQNNKKITFEHLGGNQIRYYLIFYQTASKS